jgi:hypothetical protein
MALPGRNVKRLSLIVVLPIARIIIFIIIVVIHLIANKSTTGPQARWRSHLCQTHRAS